MKLFGRTPAPRLLHRLGTVEVRERDGIRTLHLGSDIVQSAMRVAEPAALELSYTRAMAAFGLFLPAPASCLLVGLGGGSLARFLLRALPLARIEAVELRADVVSVARSHFLVPPDDDRFSVIVGDGAEHVARCCARYDVILVDAFDGRSQAQRVSTEPFYRDCRAALAPGGVVATNLWSSHADFDRNRLHLERAFDGRALYLPAERPGNVVAFGFAEPACVPSWAVVERNAMHLAQAWRMPLAPMVTALRRMNRYDRDGLQFE